MKIPRICEQQYSSPALAGLPLNKFESMAVFRPLLQEYFFPPIIFTFSPRKELFPRHPHKTFQSLGYIMKCAAAFRVCLLSDLG